MTGTTDLDIQQLRGISTYVDSLEAEGHFVARVLLHLHDSSKNIRLETRTVYQGDVLQGTRIVLRTSGEVLTSNEYAEYVRRIYSGETPRVAGPDECDKCFAKAELYHHEAGDDWDGASLCEACDLAVQQA